MCDHALLVNEQMAEDLTALSVTSSHNLVSIAFTTDQNTTRELRVSPCLARAMAQQLTDRADELEDHDPVRYPQAWIPMPLVYITIGIGLSLFMEWVVR